MREEQCPIQQSLSEVNKRQLNREKTLETVQLCYLRQLVLQQQVLYSKIKLCLNVKHDKQHIPITAHFLYSSQKNSKKIYLMTYEEPQAYQILQFQDVIQKKFTQLHHKRRCIYVCKYTYTCTSVPAKMYTTNAKQKCICFLLWSVHYQEFPPLEAADI